MKIKYVLILIAILLSSYSLFGEGNSKDLKLIPVQAKFVCMVNDKASDKEQIAVEVDGKTYYGCCQMCKQKLVEDSAIRGAVDPLTGKKVDKAKAFIVAAEDGAVMYFENEDNFHKYQSSNQK
jgi:YHS domain-containing protein